MDSASRRRLYGRLYEQLRERLLVPGIDMEAAMATLCALVHHKSPEISWTGFYRRAGDLLVVGPYQGPLACLTLPFGEGVCWAALTRRAPVLVADVAQFAGHIACDSRTKSELVLPVFVQDEDEPWGVLDLDSHQLGAFDEVDVEGLSVLLTLLSELKR